jgi:ankyrin repeat protein
MRTDTVRAFEAIRRGDAITLRRILEDGTAAGLRDADGVSLLMCAAAAGHTPIISMLVARGADVNETWPGGWTPLARAAIANSGPAVAALLAAGAHPSPVVGDHAPEPLLEFVRRQWPEREEIIRMLSAAAAPPAPLPTSQGQKT